MALMIMGSANAMQGLNDDSSIGFNTADTVKKAPQQQTGQSQQINSDIKSSTVPVDADIAKLQKELNSKIALLDALDGAVKDITEDFSEEIQKSQAELADVKTKYQALEAEKIILQTEKESLQEEANKLKSEWTKTEEQVKELTEENEKLKVLRSGASGKYDKYRDLRQSVVALDIDAKQEDAIKFFKDLKVKMEKEISKRKDLGKAIETGKSSLRKFSKFAENNENMLKPDFRKQTEMKVRKADVSYPDDGYDTEADAAAIENEFKGLVDVDAKDMFIMPGNSADIATSIRSITKDKNGKKRTLSKDEAKIYKKYIDELQNTEPYQTAITEKAGDTIKQISKNLNTALENALKP
jgi:chromosome segregation ATPase